jgi:glycosyltransferase involved in cell wall biosynthesis
VIALHVITSLERGGAQTSVTDIAIGLRARGIDARIAFSSRGGTEPDSHAGLLAALARAGVPTIDVPAMRRAPSLLDPVAAVQLERLMRRLRPDVVHTHASKAGVLGRFAAARARVPAIVHSVRGWSWHGRRGVARTLAVRAERAVAGSTHHFAAVSQAMIEAGVAHGIAARERFTVIRSGIELERFAASHDRAAARRALGLGDGCVVGTVGRFETAKAPLDFVAVAARIARRRDDVRFLWVGGGRLRRDVERAIASSGLAERFVLTGERDDVPALLAAMDAFVLLSHWEGMPRVLVEAALAGVPIVTTPAGGACELVDHGRSGLVCAPGDVDAHAGAVLRLLADRELATRLAARARGPLLAEFALDRVVEQHVALYRSLGARAR